MKDRTRKLRDPSSQPLKGRLDHMPDVKDTSVWDEIEPVDESESGEEPDEETASGGYIADLNPIPSLQELLARLFPPAR